MSDITWTNDTRKLSDLVPWEHNPKRMTKKAGAGLRVSLDKFGLAIPLVISPANDLYDGHQRKPLLAMMKEYGPDAVVDVRVSSRVFTEDERREFVIRLRQNQAGWDFDMLPNLYEREELLEWGFEPEELGLYPDEPQGDDPGAQIDRASELQEQWQTAVGQLWAIGEHRLIVGDCRDPETWERLLDGVKANGVFTSPPYAEQRKEQYGGTPTAEYVEWWEAVQANVKANLAGDGSFFVNIKPHCEDGERVLYVFDLVLAMRQRWGWRFVDELCWLHEDLPGAWPNRFRNGFEPVYQFSMDAAIKFAPRAVAKPSASVPNGRGGLQKRDGGNWTLDAPLVHGMAQPSNVIHAGGNTDGVSHAAAFPVSLLDFFIRAYSDTGDLWVDPFCGSGTTIVAAHNNGRRGYGIELLPKYAAVILERLQGMGLEPVLTGENR